jgi:hypothetical protein
MHVPFVGSQMALVEALQCLFEHNREQLCPYVVLGQAETKISFLLNNTLPTAVQVQHVHVQAQRKATP